ncbi:hypothetical protein BH11PSE2_BH11PSE2_07000 [soil metagenome]
MFAVSSGRAGTATLSKIFGAVPGVYATHEGRPAFQDVMRRSMQEPNLAGDFLLTRKLPAIAGVEEPIYFESSHVFGKGFLAPMLRLGLKPRVLFVKRDPRKVALSFERIGATPFRTHGGREHLLSPADPSFLPALRWEDFTDYQLCYWYALETIRRQRLMFDLAVRAGCHCRHLKIENLNSVADVRALLAALAIRAPISAEAAVGLGETVGRAFNLKQKSPQLGHASAELDDQERVVIERIEACLPELSIAQMVARYGDEPINAKPTESVRDVGVEGRSFLAQELDPSPVELEPTRRDRVQNGSGVRPSR